MSTLVGRIAIKDLANIARSDTRYDSVLDDMREHASRQIEEITARQFDKIARTELHPSYQQSFGDPSAQYIVVNAPPIDQAVVPVLTWAPYDDHDTNGTPLTNPEDWRYELDARGDAYGLRVQRLTSVPANLPIPPGAIGLLGDSPTGFQVTYTGGFTVSVGTAVAASGYVFFNSVPTATDTLVLDNIHFEFTAGASSSSGSLPPGSHGNPILVTIASGTVSGVIDELITIFGFPDIPAQISAATYAKNTEATRLVITHGTPGAAGNSYSLSWDPATDPLTVVSGVSLTGGSDSPTDPVDAGEADVVAVPAGLASLIAQKLADDFKFFLAQRTQAVTDPSSIVTNAQQTGGFGVVSTPGLVRPWSENQLAYLLTFARKDTTWIGPQWSRAAGRAVGGK